MRQEKSSVTVADVMSPGVRSIAPDATLADAFGVVLELARAHGLTVYDASYLALAARERLPLASSDDRLRAAATAAGVELVAQEG